MESLKDYFQPVLEIYPTEYRRKIFLEEFIKYAYTPIEYDDESTTYSLPFTYNLDRIYRSYMFTLEREDAITIASFISYLGTNGGRCLLDTFEKFSESSFFKSKEDAFVHAWLSENSRKIGINHNLRAIEFMLTPLEKHKFHYGLDDFSINDIKSSQYEIIELTVKWLSTPAGVTYLLNCADLIDQAKDNTHEIRKVARKP